MTNSQRMRESADDDVLHHAVGEVFLLGVAAQVQERQDGNRGLVGKGQRLRGCCIGFGDTGRRRLDVIR